MANSQIFKNLKIMKAKIILFSFILIIPAALLATWFSSPVNISNNPDQYDTQSSIAVDKNNDTHIVWMGTYAQAGAPDGVTTDIFYSDNSGGSFSAPLKISVPTGWYSHDVSITVDSNCHVHIAFRRSEDQTNLLSEDDIYYVTNKNGNFNNPTLLVEGKFGYLNPGEVTMPQSPNILCDSQDNIHLTFEVWQFGDSDACGLILYMNNMAGAWGSPIVAVGNHFSNAIFMHHSCLDKDGHVHIVYDEYAVGVVYYTSNVSGSFSERVVVSAPGHPHATEPDVAVDSKGKVHIVYRAPFLINAPELYYVNNISGNFNTWIPLTPDYGLFAKPNVAIDESDYVHIAYKSSPGYDGLLYYGNNRNGDFEFTTYGNMTDWWVATLFGKYFALGKNGTLHFTFYDWVGGDDDTEIYYLGGSWLSITVTSPNGGENWMAGTVHNITWTSTEMIANVKIEYSINNGSNWSNVIASTANDGSHPWTIPNTPSGLCLVRISDAANAATNDTSNATFSIVPVPTLTVTSPNGGENWMVGTAHNITWTSTGMIANVKIEYSINEGSNWSNVIASTANDGSHPWTIPNTPSSQCLVRISDATNAAIKDTSNAVFSIMMSLDLLAERREVKAFSILRQYGQIQFTVDNSGIPVAQYRLLRRKGAADFVLLRTITPQELQNNQFQMQDKYLENGTSYTYRVEAYNAAEQLLGLSLEKTI